MRINSYPKVWALGHEALDGDIFDGDVVIQEKIDGSQFSFGIIDGELVCRSKNVEIDLDNPGMFASAVNTVQDILPLLVKGYIYRAEFLSKPKHNTLAYDQIPVGHIIGYDVEIGPSKFLRPSDAAELFSLPGLQFVPTYYQGTGENLTLDKVKNWTKSKPVLGGPMVEGVVIKNYDMVLSNGKIAMAKYVRDDFKESHRDDWKKRNPNRADVIEKLIAIYGNEMRYKKAVQHLRESGNLDESPRDIGPLIKEFSVDLYNECKDEIAEQLFKHFWKQIQKGAAKGIPSWYKEELAKGAME